FYIMYFPHLISGPIVRFHELFWQYRTPIERPSALRVRKGLELIVLGAAYKILLADSSSVVVDPVFANPQNAGAIETYLAVIAFSAQIYFDFLGYTHIARGASLLFNLELPINFDHPYNATNMSEFWQKWHITLSRWIRDYLFISLGGSRFGI